MGLEVQEEQAFPWTHPEVVSLHTLFDQEFAQTHSPEEGEALFRRFFSPTEGLVEQKLAEWRGKDAPFNEVMTLAFELYSFSCFIFSCFFFNDYPEEIVKEWWKDPGMRSWVHEKAFQEPSVLKVKEQFDHDATNCRTMLDLEGLRGKYLSPQGIIAREFGNLKKLSQKKQVAIGAELLSLKSYIDYGLFATEYSAKTATWIVPEVRKIQYQFENDLKALQSDEEFRALEQRYMGIDGVLYMAEQEAEAKKGSSKLQHVEELGRLRDALQSFFSSHTKEEK